MSYVLALLSSVFVGLGDFSSGFLGKRVKIFAVIGGAAMVAAAIFLIVGLATHQLVFDELDVTSGLLAGVLTLIGNVFYITAMARGRMGVISGITTLLVLVPIVWDVRERQLPQRSPWPGSQS